MSSAFSDRLLDELRTAEERRRTATRGPLRSGAGRRGFAIALAVAACAAAIVVAVAALSGGRDGGAVQRGPAVAGPALPTVSATGACPVSAPEENLKGYGLGVGGPTFYAVGFGATVPIAPPEYVQSHRWWGAKTLWVVRPGAPAAVVTGRRLDGPGELRFDDGDVPTAGSLTLPAPDGTFTISVPSSSRMEAPGCYAWIVTAGSRRQVIVFRAVDAAHEYHPGSIQRGVRARDLERAIVDPPRLPADAATPYDASCASPRTGADRALVRTRFGSTTRPVFVCAVGERATYLLQVLGNGCYTGGEIGGRRGLQGCGVKVPSTRR